MKKINPDIRKFKRLVKKHNILPTSAYIYDQSTNAYIDLDPERIYDFIIKNKSLILKLIKNSESANTFWSDYI